MDHLYRKCVGMLILNNKKEILVGKRLDHPSGFWQMPQGGIDEKENPEDAVWREMMEEIGTNKAKLIKVSNQWINYDIPYETLKTLKSYGFKTFSPIINEDYDNEQDSEKRMDMVIQEIKKFSEMPITEVDRIFWQFKDILVHNFLHLKKYINDIDDILIKEICL